MMGLPSLHSLDQAQGVRIWLATEKTDMRCGFDRLAERVKTVIGEDPLSGHWFVFRSRRGDRLKILVWDEDGFVLWYKRLEAGVFKLPRVEEGARSVELRASELAMVLDGIDRRSSSACPHDGRRQECAARKSNAILREKTRFCVARNIKGKITNTISRIGRNLLLAIQMAAYEKAFSRELTRSNAENRSFCCCARGYRHSFSRMARYSPCCELNVSCTTLYPAGTKLGLFSFSSRSMAFFPNTTM